MMKVCKKTVDSTGVLFQFSNEQDIHINIKDIPEDMKVKLLLHGLSQKGGDSYASSVSVEDAIGRLKVTLDNLIQGRWNVKVGSGGKIVEAFSRATKQSMEDCSAKYASMDKTEQTALRKHPSIIKALADMAQEAACAVANNSSVDDLMELF